MCTITYESIFAFDRPCLFMEILCALCTFYQYLVLLAMSHCHALNCDFNHNH